jgi:hypothetical protein
MPLKRRIDKRRDLILTPKAIALFREMRAPNTWVIRYGDAEWKQFLDFWCTYLVVNGEIDRLFKHHMEKLGAA